MAERHWQPPEGYYETIAETNVNGAVHLAGRAAMSTYTHIRFGRPIIDRTEAFIEAQESFSEGNIITVAAHRDELDTLLLPSVLERVGIHHSRPISKDENFAIHPSVAWALHKLGAYCIYRPKPDLEGLEYTTTRILERGGNVTDYLEATRVRQNTRKIAKIGRSIAFLAAPNDSLIVPVGIAGLSSEYEGKKPDWVKVSRDKRYWLGIGKRLVFAFGDPLRLGRLPDFETDKQGRLSRDDMAIINKLTKERSKTVHDAMQKAQDRAYEVRGSSQEQTYKLTNKL